VVNNEIHTRVVYSLCRTVPQLKEECTAETLEVNDVAMATSTHKGGHARYYMSEIEC